MPNWTYLSKQGQDEYIEKFARGAAQSVTVLESWNWDCNQDALVIRGIMKHKIIKQCWQQARPFRFIDTGYFGNHAYSRNPHGWKLWHRIVPNNLQHNELIERPADRWQQLNINLQPRQPGSKILIAMPDEKPCVFYGIDMNDWLQSVVANIASVTDRPIEIRYRDPNRTTRNKKPFAAVLDNVHAVVTFNSNAATEAIIAGVPAFVLAPCHAARPVANTDLAKIDTPFWPDQDLREAWVHHLAYGQFHITEMQSGAAHRILDQTDQLKGPLWNSP